MSWLRQHRRSAVLVGLTVVIPVFILLRSLIGIAAVGIEYAGERGRIEPRLARLQGLLDKQELLAERSSEANRVLRQLAYPSEQDPTALAASLQAEVRQILDTAGLEVSNSQVMPARQEAMFDQVAVKLTVKGSLPAFNAALIGIAAYQPQLLVETLDLFPARGERRPDGQPEQSLTAVIQLLALRQTTP